MNTVTIVIPTKNRKSILEKTLPSYLNQQGVTQVVLINDGSTDDTKPFLLSMAQKDTRIHYVEHAKSMGASKSRNEGVSLATGEYIFIGDDDMELSETHIATLLEHMQKHHAAIGAGRKVQMHIGKTKKEELQRVNKITHSPINYSLLTSDFEAQEKDDTLVPIVDAAMIIHKDVLATISYSEAYLGNYWREETDFQFQASENGFTLLYCPHTIAFHLAKINDTGGIHSLPIWKFEYWVIKNNYHFIKTHAEYIKKTFGINNIYLYMIRFIINRLEKNIVHRIHL